MHTASYEFLMKPKESARCHQTLSARVGSGDETIYSYTLHYLLTIQEYLTTEKCLRAVSLRGLIRIWCAQHISHILHFLTKQGYVNCGFMTHAPRPFPSEGSQERKSSVLIVGAGPAGLASANHLRNFGYKVSPSDFVILSVKHLYIPNG